MKNNTGKILAAVLAFVMVVTCAAVILSDDQVQAAEDEQGYFGTVSTYQPFPADTNIVITSNTTITEGGIIYVQGNFRVASGVTLTIEDGGQLIIVSDGANTPKVTIEGTVNVSGSGNVTLNSEAQTAVGSIISAGEQPSAIIIQGESSGSVTKNPTFEDSGIIISGSVTVTDGAAFKTTGAVGSETVGSILVSGNGALDVTKKSSDVANISNMNVYLAVGGTFDYSGRATNLNVYTYGTGNVKTIASASITTGDDAEGRDTSSLSFSNISSNVTGYYAAADADKATAQSVKQYALGVSGTVSNFDTITFDGEVVETTPSGNTYFTSEDAALRNADSEISDKYLYYNDKVMAVVDVSGNLTINQNAGMTIDSGAFVSVSGTLRINETYMSEDRNSDVKESVTINGVLEISGTLTTDGDSVGSSSGTVAMNGGTATIYNFSGALGDASFYGAYYEDDEGDAHAGDLGAIIQAASAANIEEVTVHATFGSENSVDGYGGYIVSSDITIPANINLYIADTLVINLGVTVTVSENATIEFDDDQRDGDSKYVYVNGKLVDYDSGIEEEYMKFEVKSVDDSGAVDINTYCSLATALAETTSGTIYLYSEVTIDGTMTIGENVTVMFNDEEDFVDSTAKIKFHDEDAVLNVNGTLYLAGDHTIDTAVGEEDATVNVNNMIVFDNEVVPGTYSGQMTIPGAYFQNTIGDYEDKYFIASPAVAAANSSGVDGNIVLYGALVMGDVTFTQGEDNELIVEVRNNVEDEVATGNVTLVGDVTFGVGFENYRGLFNGTVTSGETSFNINGEDFGIIVSTAENAEGVSETTVGLTTYGFGDGTVEITSGTVTAVSTTDDDEVSANKIVVAEGATLVIPEGTTVSTEIPQGYRFNTIPNSMPLFNEKNISGAAGFIVNGTVTAEGNIKAWVAYINGTVTMTENANFNSYLTMVNGTLATEDSATATLTMSIINNNGTLSGKASIEELIAFVGSDVSGVEMTVGLAPSYGGLTEVVSTVFYVNGNEVLTAYAGDTVAIEGILLFTDSTGLKTNTAEFYTDEAMTNMISDMAGTISGQSVILADLNAVISAVRGLSSSDLNVDGLMTALGNLTTSTSIDAMIGDYTAIYIGMEPAIVNGTISAGTGLDLYIDNIKFVPGVTDMELGVGTHTVSFDVQTGYDGTNAVITFNGQTVENGGTINVTADMTEFTLVASGAVPSNSTVVIDNGNGGSDMGLTDYLLIILVILIVVMAIIVAMRLMRS